MARARAAGSADLKTPDPTKTASAPGCIMIAAAAALAAPPARLRADVGHRQPTFLRHPPNHLHRGAQFLRLRHQLLGPEGREPLDVAGDLPDVPDGLDDVAGAGLPLGADHRRALAD